MTSLCTNLCMGRLNKNFRDCRSWCRSTPPLLGPSTSLELPQQQHPERLNDLRERQEQNVEDSSRGIVTTKRQVDPLLSCIEARCAGLVQHSMYGSCIYSKCIASWRKRSSPSTFSSPSFPSSIKKRTSLWKDEGDGGPSAEEVGLVPGQWIDLHLQTLPQATSKRSWNDVMQTCIEYNCRDTRPGSFEYQLCIHQSCSKHMFGRR